MTSSPLPLNLMPLLFICCSSSITAQPNGYELSLAADSKYISEGRDTLNGEGLLSVLLMAEISGGLSAGVWHADGINTDYSETKFSLIYQAEFDILELEVGYTRLRFDQDPGDNEFNVAAISNSLMLELSANVVYATQTGGAFVETQIQKEFEFAKHMTLSPYLMLNLDYGFASDTHNGINNYQLGLEYRARLVGSAEISAYVAHSFAGKDVKLDGGGNQSWAGLAMTWVF